MKKLPDNQETLLSYDPLVLQIWEDVVYAMDQYTHDAAVSKFFLPSELIDHCRSMAASFALLHFSPLPDMQTIYRSRLFSILYVSTSCGVQIFLKERSIMTQNAPYALQCSERDARDAKNRVLKQLTDGLSVHAPVSEVMSLFLQQLSPMKERVKRSTKDISFNENLYDKFLPVTMIWGYLFAREIVIDC